MTRWVREAILCKLATVLPKGFFHRVAATSSDVMFNRYKSPPSFLRASLPETGGLDTYVVAPKLICSVLAADIKVHSQRVVR